jgi:hypothetical protein
VAIQPATAKSRAATIRTVVSDPPTAEICGHGVDLLQNVSLAFSKANSEQPPGRAEREEEGWSAWLTGVHIQIIITI